MITPHSETATSEPLSFKLQASHPELSERGGPGLINGKPSYSVDQSAAQISRSGHTWKDLDKDGKVHLTYAFLDSPPANFVELGVDVGISGFSAFSDVQKAQAKLAMQSWADVANLSFTEAQVGGDGHLELRQLQCRAVGGLGVRVPAAGRARLRWAVLVPDRQWLRHQQDAGPEQFRTFDAGSRDRS